MIRNIAVIGEAARNVERCDPEFSASHAEVPLQLMYAMRNRVTHGYFEVDVQILWRTVQGDLPVLERQIQGLLGDRSGKQERGLALLRKAAKPRTAAPRAKRRKGP